MTKGVATGEPILTKSEVVFLKQLANDYSQQGFEWAAAELLRRSDKAESRRIYIQLARRASEARLPLLAAECYERAGCRHRARQSFMAAAAQFSRAGLDRLARSVREPAYEDPREMRVMRNIIARADNLMARGKFRAAQLCWLEAGRMQEANGDFYRAMRLYFNAGDIHRCRRVWRLLRETKKNKEKSFA